MNEDKIREMIKQNNGIITVTPLPDNRNKKKNDLANSEYAVRLIDG